MAKIDCEGAEYEILEDLDQSQLLKNFDAEHKGKLTPKQKQQAVEFIQNNRPQVFETLIKKYDFNGNGKLDEEEITKFFGDLEKTISTKEENEMGM